MRLQQIIVAVAIIHAHDEVRQVLAHFRTIAVRHFQAEVVVLDVGANAGMRFGHAAELALPIAVENHPVDVTAARVSLPASRSSRC